MHISSIADTNKPSYFIRWFCGSVYYKGVFSIVITIFLSVVVRYFYFAHENSGKFISNISTRNPAKKTVQ